MNGGDGSPHEQREERYRITRLGGLVGQVADETVATSHPGAPLRHNAVIRVKVQHCADTIWQSSSAGLNRAAEKVVGRVALAMAAYPIKFMR